VGGILMAASTVDSLTGQGVYYCGYQTNAHFKMVKFTLDVSSTGDLYAKSVQAKYKSGTATADVETTWASVSGSASLASSFTSRGYAIASLSYYILP
jgi:hypothetical protein